MVRFKIKEIKGQTLPRNRNADCVIYHAVYAYNISIKEWIFLGAFYTMERAEKFVHDLNKKIRKGDYSCLTLRT